MTRPRTCPKKTHRWTLEGGHRCSVCWQQRTRMPGTPALVRLDRLASNGQTPYCELCGKTVELGEPVAWWPVLKRGRKLPTAYCATCHSSNVRAGTALR